MTAFDLLTIGVLAFIAYRLVGGVREVGSRRGRVLTLTIVRGIRWRHCWPAVPVLAVVVAVASALLAIPGLDWGWWTALGGEGNPVFGSSERTVGTLWEWLIPLVFLVLLIPALPLFAHAEERLFRGGAERWSTSRRAATTLGFGLAHAVIGIPIGAALALSVGGAYFMAVYLRSWRTTGNRWHATLESARAHTAYNATIVGLVVLALAVTPFL